MVRGQFCISKTKKTNLFQSSDICPSRTCKSTKAGTAPAFYFKTNRITYVRRVKGLLEGSYMKGSPVY